MLLGLHEDASCPSTIAESADAGEARELLRRNTFVASTDEEIEPHDREARILLEEWRY